MVGTRFLTGGARIVQENLNEMNSIQLDLIYFHENGRTQFWRWLNCHSKGCQPQGPSSPHNVFLENIPQTVQYSVVFSDIYMTKLECVSVTNGSTARYGVVTFQYAV